MATARRARSASPDFTPASSPSLRTAGAAPPDADTAVQYARGVGPSRAALLERLGISTVRDLLYHLPRRLEDRSHLRPIYDLQHGAVETIQGTIGQLRQFRPRGRRGLVITRATIVDPSGVLHAIWYNQPYLARQLVRGRAAVLHGRVQRRSGEIQMVAPEFELLEKGEETLHIGRIVPVYRSTEGLTQRILRTVMFHALEEYPSQMQDWLPERLRRQHQLPDLPSALRQAHFPEDARAQAAARRRLVYEELLLLQLVLLRQKAAAAASPRAVHYGNAAELVARFHQSLPFALTAAQRRVIAEIARDLAKPHPMNRLLQGDVASGKTVVAATSLLQCVGGGAQGALMAPTEILAEQHYLTLRRLLGPLGLTVILLVGALSRSARQEALEGARDGQADIVVGTHALIEDDVAFHRLGLVVVDEQHRFGVTQRAALRQKGDHPDVLVMTATPIPRTLALTLYGDLDVSTLDEMPPGRSPVKTYARPTTRRPQVYEFVRAQIADGRQAYIVCPLIEESDKLQTEAATKLAARLQEGVLRGLRVDVLHGRMKVEKREAVMRAFREGRIDVLVATTVIEVGIDIPNASVMVIEDADRFGLSQLHQLRGRVGRGAHQAYCILIADPKDDDTAAAARLDVMVETGDGFLIAQRDLELRGAGELLGDRRLPGLRQHGLTDLRVADLVRDHAWLEQARRDAGAVLLVDPHLGRPEHRGLAEALQHRFGSARVEHVRVG
jgi:ATP-dependent DNA helicase RecG